MSSASDICKQAGDIFGRKHRIKTDPPLKLERDRIARQGATADRAVRMYRFTPQTAQCFWCGKDVSEPVPTQPAFLCKSVFVSYCDECT